MSEWKTLDELITEWCKEASLGGGLLEAPVFWGLVEEHAPHYHIIPGAHAIVTPQGLEDAAKVCAGNLLSMKAGRRLARAAIEAAGVVCVDEVIAVKGGRQVMFPKPLGRCTLFIKRAVTGKEDRSTTSTRSADVSKAEAAIDKRAVTDYCDKED